MKAKGKVLTMVVLLLAHLPMVAATISYNECSWNSSTYSQSTGNKQGQLVVSQSYEGAAGIGCANNSPGWQERSNVYKASAFDKATGWSRFLDKNLQKIDPEVNPVNTSTIVPFWLGD